MNMIEKRKAQAGQGGFTLIELLVVIAILAVLGGAAIIGIGTLRSSSEVQVCRTDKETIELAAEAQKVAANSATYAANPAGLSTFLRKQPKGTWTIAPATGVATVTAYGNLDGPGITACMAP